MPRTVFVALGILGYDFLLYAFSQWSYGEKRRSHLRRRANDRGTNRQSPPPHVLRSKSPAPERRDDGNERLAYRAIVSSFPPPRR